jgi:hypothetical protein
MRLAAILGTITFQFSAFRNDSRMHQLQLYFMSHAAAAYW